MKILVKSFTVSVETVTNQVEKSESEYYSFMEVGFEFLVNSKS
jgi:hypothetical protein